MAKYFFLRMFALLPKTFGGIKTILNISPFDRISATEQASVGNWGLSSGPTIMVPGCSPYISGKWWGPWCFMERTAGGSPTLPQV